MIFATKVKYKLGTYYKQEEGAYVSYKRKVYLINLNRYTKMKKIIIGW